MLGWKPNLATILMHVVFLGQKTAFTSTANCSDISSDYLEQMMNCPLVWKHDSRGRQ